MTKSPKEAAAAAEEIRVLQEQMKEMQRRLDALCAEQSADVEDVENDESSSQDAESVSGPDEANAASGASSQDAYSVSEQAAYQPPVNPVSGYTAQQTQPFVSGAPVPPPSYDAAAQQAAQQQQAYYGHPTGQQAYQSGGASYSSSYGSSAQTPYNPYGQTVYQQPVVRTKDHVAAGLLGIFLGSLGVHKFYLGYNTAGFIMLGVAILGGLLSFGIATSIVWLIGLIEGIIYLVKNQAEFEQAYVFSKREWF
ncbi:NINE protein [Slackia sp.]|uniref:NINE protein n=1 Tax=Slackia sp. TaxID=2049041 RepID=UPI00399C1370